MLEDTFYLKIEAIPEKFEIWLSGVSIPAVYYKTLLPNQKDIMRCTDVRLRKIQSDEGGFTHFLICADCNINYFVSDSRPFYETRQEELSFGFIKFIDIDETHLFIVSYRHDDKWIGVVKRLFEIIKSDYRPGEPDLQMLDEKNIVLETVKMAEKITADGTLPKKPRAIQVDDEVIQLKNGIENGSELEPWSVSKAEHLLSGLPDPDDTVKKYGTDRNLTTNDVRGYVRQCRAFQASGGTVESYYNNKFMTNPLFSLDTLRSWLKNPKFAPKEDT